MRGFESGWEMSFLPDQKLEGLDELKINQLAGTEYSLIPT